MELRRRLVLASASPRRLELLGAVGIHCAVHPADIDESSLPDEPSGEHVLRLAKAKAMTVAARLREEAGDDPAPAIVGADTIVEIDGRILGKPRDDADAQSMLRALSGRWHRVTTAVSVLVADRRLDEVVSTEVRFRVLGANEIDAYIATGEGRDKAGSYAIQGIAMGFAPEVRGSYTNIVGLPVVETLGLLRELGVIGSWP